MKNEGVARDGFAQPGLAELPNGLPIGWASFSSAEESLPFQANATCRWPSGTNAGNRYHQRGPLEHTCFGPFRRLVLGCIEAQFCK